MASIENNYADHYSEKSFWEKLKSTFKKIGRPLVEKALILYYVGIDPVTPIWAKTIAFGALGYLICPLDAIYDTIPLVGFADDLGAVTAALASISAHTTEEHMEEHIYAAKKKTPEWFGEE